MSGELQRLVSYSFGGERFFVRPAFGADAGGDPAGWHRAGWRLHEMEPADLRLLQLHRATPGQDCFFTAGAAGLLAATEVRREDGAPA